MIDKNEPDLKTLEYIKFSFDLYSDMSSKTLGYSHLCATIEEIKQATRAETSKGKALNIGNVSKQSELLKAFIRWNNKHNGIAQPVPEKMADNYLESL